jgi:hypothetical protein
MRAEDKKTPIQKYTTSRTAFFWVITQRVMVTFYGRFGATYRSQHQGSRIQVGFLTPEDGTARLSRNVRNKLPLLAA